jgi:hypothetical protein
MPTHLELETQLKMKICFNTKLSLKKKKRSESISFMSFTLRYRQEEIEAKRKAEEVMAQELGDVTKMSARERNKAKRKAKQLLKQEETTHKQRKYATLESCNHLAVFTKKQKTLKNVVTDQPQASDKIVIEAVADREHSNEEWDFEGICLDLLHTVFE